MARLPTFLAEAKQVSRLWDHGTQIDVHLLYSSDS